MEHLEGFCQRAVSAKCFSRGVLGREALWSEGKKCEFGIFIKKFTKFWIFKATSQSLEACSTYLVRNLLFKRYLWSGITITSKSSILIQKCLIRNNRLNADPIQLFTREIYPQSQSPRLNRSEKSEYLSKQKSKNFQRRAFSMNLLSRA